MINTGSTCLLTLYVQMIYPGYQLNPGDMFQVDPERVLYATGAPKDRTERRAGRKLRALRASQKEAAAEETTSDPEPAAEPQTPSSPPPPESTAPAKSTKETLQSLLAQAKLILTTPSQTLTARRKQDLRAFQRTVKRTLSRPDAFSTATSLDAQLQEITAKMAPEKPTSKPKPPNSPLNNSTPSDSPSKKYATTPSMRQSPTPRPGARENGCQRLRLYLGILRCIIRSAVRFMCGIRLRGRGWRRCRRPIRCMLTDWRIIGI